MQGQPQAGPKAAHGPEKSRHCFMAQPSQPRKKQDSQRAAAGELHHQGSWGTSEAKENSA